MVELKIQNGSTVYLPCIEDEITWETSRKGVPGKLEFSVVKDEIISFQEGNLVQLKVDNKKVFNGHIFTKKRSSDQIIKVTAYDQLRYLKNKDTKVFENRTASQIIKSLADDFQLVTGTIEDTGYVIETRVEDNKTLMDMIQSALDITMQNRNKMYVLFDDYGAISLKSIDSMKLDILIEKSTAEDFDYTSSIDSNTYNLIKLAYDNDKTKKREIYEAKDSNKIAEWGLLQYYEKVNQNTNAKAKADGLLKLYNKKTRNLSVSNAIGDIRVRGGCLFPVWLELGDVKVQNYMLVETVKHTFKSNQHYMDITLRGGDFVA
ncbi:XkdQ/YqbQ family protein [Ruminiclostridium papyrosolvens]|uniref:Hydrolase n=1 Tax=Ruminiclostridium papyrosolvens C7 TaxID=1330534 RepID=U4R258_9FIRM|nr:hydrolase [Ruminiclostridium papyrosolvens]EPR12310.1 hydrolase [Ruminiclostridium papyrosolvens C7]